MKTSYKLFTKEQTDNWELLLDIKQKVETLRKVYLTPCKLKKNRSILKKEERNEFLKEFDAVHKESEEITHKIIDDVQSAILDSKTVLKKELAEFYENNPPKDILATTNNNVKKRMIEDYVETTPSRAKIPSAMELLLKIKLEKQDAEFTTEDLQNEEFLEWFKEKGLISSFSKNSIANFDTAFKTKR